jgi:hypothetical protein
MQLVYRYAAVCMVTALEAPGVATRRNDTALIAMSWSCYVLRFYVIWRRYLLMKIFSSHNNTVNLANPFTRQNKAMGLSMHRLVMPNVISLLFYNTVTYYALPVQVLGHGGAVHVESSCDPALESRLVSQPLLRL